MECDVLGSKTPPPSLGAGSGFEGAEEGWLMIRVRVRSRVITILGVGLGLAEEGWLMIRLAREWPLP